MKKNIEYQTWVKASWRVRKSYFPLPEHDEQLENTSNMSNTDNKGNTILPNGCR